MATADEFTEASTMTTAEEVAEQSSSKQQLPTAAAEAAVSALGEVSTSTGETAPSNANANIEFEPPAACIRRLLKQCLPKSTNVSKDSLAAISRASGIFVLYLTACANDVAREGRRTTIVAKDVLGALKELDFEDFLPAMDVFLEGYRKEEKSKKEEKEMLKLKRVQQMQQQQEQNEEELSETGAVASGGGEGDQEGENDGTLEEGEKDVDGEKDEDEEEEEGGGGGGFDTDREGSIKHERDDEVEGEDQDDEEAYSEPLTKKQK